MDRIYELVLENFNRNTIFPPLITINDTLKHIVRKEVIWVLKFRVRLKSKDLRINQFFESWTFRNICSLDSDLTVWF